MASEITALVMGSGFAGQGHTQALRYCGVEVIGMVSRSSDTVSKIAKKLDIPYASTNWKQALVDLQPTIVAIGTPGGVHYEPIMDALAYKAHIFCDKPLAETAEKAQRLYEQAQSMGVKTAYAASYRYQPNVQYAHNLIQQGAIGMPQEIECISHFNLEKLIPFGWSHRIEQGGGRLNNNFTHKLSIVQYMLDGKIGQVVGSTRNDMGKAPIVVGVHDFRNRRDFVPNEDELDKIKWADVNAEWSYTATIDFSSPYASKPVSALFKHSGLHPRFSDDHIVVYGEDSAILMKGCYGQGDLYIYESDQGWVQKDVPEHILQKLPHEIEDDTQRNWTALMQAFVADIQGETHEPYQTFYDGWHYQSVVESIRAESE